MVFGQPRGSPTRGSRTRRGDVAVPVDVAAPPVASVSSRQKTWAGEAFIVIFDGYLQLTR
jgi:hypothetical protein